MEENNTIKISLTTFFLLLAIIVIIVMGIFIYNIYNARKNEIEKNENLQSQIDNLQEKMESIASNINSDNTIKDEENKEQSKKYSYDDLEGLYQGSIKSNTDTDLIFELFLDKNGLFSYSNEQNPDGIRSGYVGNYIIKDNTIILNYIFTLGNDVGMGITDGQRILKINSDGSIVDDSKKSERFKEYIDNLYVTMDLKKVDKSQVDTEYYNLKRQIEIAFSHE